MVVYSDLRMAKNCLGLKVPGACGEVGDFRMAEDCSGLKVPGIYGKVGGCRQVYWCLVVDCGDFRMAENCLGLKVLSVCGGGCWCLVRAIKVVYLMKFINSSRCWGVNAEEGVTGGVGESSVLAAESMV